MMNIFRNLSCLFHWLRYPAVFLSFSIFSSFRSTFIFPSVFSPFLSAAVKVTYFELSPYSDFFACDALKFFAFSTCFFISKICLSANFWLNVTTRFSFNFTVFFHPLPGMGNHQCILLFYKAYAHPCLLLPGNHFLTAPMFFLFPEAA